MNYNLQFKPGCISWCHYSLSGHHGCDMVSRACWNCWAKDVSHKFRLGVTKLAKGVPQWNGRFQAESKILAAISSKSEKAVLADLQEIYNYQEDGHYLNRERFPNGAVLPGVIFFDSMSDFFHDEAMKDEDFLADVLSEMGSQAHKFHFQLVTKRTKNMLEFSKRHKLPQNVWAMATVETTDRNANAPSYVFDKKENKELLIPPEGLFYTKAREWKPASNFDPKDGGRLVKPCRANWAPCLGGGTPPWERIGHLLEVNAAVKGLSIEPMAGPVDLSLIRKQPPSERHKWWAIIGGESDGGDRSKPLIRLCDLKKELKDLLSQCKDSGIPVWFKQYGSWDAKGEYLGSHVAAGHKVDGKFRLEWPKPYLEIISKKKGY